MSIRDLIWEFAAYCAKSSMPEIDLNTSIDQKVLWGKMNNPVPENAPWVGLAIKDIDPTKSKRKEKALPIDISQIVTVESLISVSVDIYGRDAYELALGFIAATKESDALDIALRNKLSLVGFSNINDLSTVVDSIWEGRANFTMRIMHSYVKKSIVTQIKSVTIDGAVDDHIEVSINVDLTG